MRAAMEDSEERTGPGLMGRPGAFAIILALALGSLAVGAGPASAQLFGQNKVQYHPYDWRRISSDHFDVYYDTKQDSLALRVLDLAEKADVYLAARMGHQLTQKVPIILYGSHNEFAQTNVTPELIEGNTGGFTEVYRNRVVLPFTGSYEDFRHVVVHELTHAFMFDMLYGGQAGAMIARQAFFSPPLWFAEGLAEYLSLGVDDSNMEMFLRDGTFGDFLPPLQYANGYIVYKQGQAALGYLVERFGEDRLRELLQRMRTTRDFDMAFTRVMGTTVSKFDQDWKRQLKRIYWPQITSKGDPDQYARRLTDHRRDESNFNTAPAISPQGDRIAYYSDRRQYTDIYVMSALDGKVLRRLVRSEKSSKFESVPSFRGSLTWSPDGRHLAMTAKSQGRDVLYVVDSRNGRLERSIDLGCEALNYPAWSPVGDSVVVAGLLDGRSDLYMVDLKASAIVRLTDDAYDEREPTWTPDGRSVTFASDRHAPVVLQAPPPPRGASGYGIYSLDMATHTVRPVIDTAGDDHWPQWSRDGSKLAFISDYAGSPDAFLFDLSDSTVLHATDVIGGIQSLSWSRQNDRIALAVYNAGGFDIFTVKEPLSLDARLARIRKQRPHDVLTLDQVSRVVRYSVASPALAGALAGAWPDSIELAADTLTSPKPLLGPLAPTVAPLGAAAVPTAVADSARAGTPDSIMVADGHAPVPADSAAGVDTATAHTPVPADSAMAALPDTAHATAPVDSAVAALPDTAQAPAPKAEAPPHAVAPPPPWAGSNSDFPIRPDTLASLMASHALIERGGPFALPDTVLGQKPTRYRVRYSADYAGGTLYATNAGALGATQVSLSDFLGDRRIDIALGLYSNSLSDANVYLAYSYLPRRWDVTIAAFHYKEYFESRFTSLGEQFSSDQLYSDRNFGVSTVFSYPFDRFLRAEFGLTQRFVERTFFVQDAFGDLLRTSQVLRSVTSPSIALVGDYTLFGYYGPVNGQRFNLTYSPALPLGGDAISYQTVTLDWRRYIDLTHGYTFVRRFLAGYSDGKNPQYFRIGGFSTLRGYSPYSVVGSRIGVANLELRFPFIQQLGLVGPLPIGMFNIKGAAFTDIGIAFNQGYSPRFSAVGPDGQRRLQDGLFDYGAGIRTYFLYILMKLDVAWRWNGQETSKPVWQFSIGSEL